MAVKKDEKPVAPADGGQSSEPSVDYAKQIEELKSSFEKKLGEQGEQLGQFQEYVTGTSAILNAIAADPNLTQQVREKLLGQNVPAQQQPQAQNQGNPPSIPQSSDNQIARTVNDVVQTQRVDTIREFEREMGILDLPKEEQEAARKRIGEELASFGWTINDLPTQNLRASLQKAYTLTQAEKLREEGKLEGFAQARTNSIASMGNITGGAPQVNEQTTELTPKQKEWMKKLGVKDEEGAKKLYQDRENEKDREPEDKK